MQARSIAPATGEGTPARGLAAGGLVAVVALLLAACGGPGNGSAKPTTPKGLYRAYCLTCHGVDGQGGVGPRLAGLMTQKYPDVDDQIAVVTGGRGAMPSFRGDLTPEEIRKVVEYERTDLGT